MDEVILFDKGSYKYIKGPFQYSGGVIAEPGFTIERVRFMRSPSLAEGFQIIKSYLTGLGRPLTSFCACELRSPKPFNDKGFIEFNRLYVGTLEKWGIYYKNVNPVARSNVCPELNPPAEPQFHAFSYTIPNPTPKANSFIIAGAAEAEEGIGNYSQRTIRIGETSPDAMREKAAHVLRTMEYRMSLLGAGWNQTTAAQVYTVYDFHSFLGEEIISRGASNFGLTWHYARPPVYGLDYEMDTRRIQRELFI